MMDLARNRFKHAIAAGHLQIGLWCSLCSNIAADIVRDSGFDWLLLDTEHSPSEIPDVLSQLQACEGGAATPIVRPAWNDTVIIKRCLDIGAQTLLVPYVQNPDEAKRAVDAVFIGPSDLSASLGHIGNPAHPDVQKALETCVRRLKAVGKPAGILTGNEEEVRRYISWGYTFVAVGSDVGLLSRGADALAKKFRS